jgi:hypothetical protein
MQHGKLLPLLVAGDGFVYNASLVQQLCGEIAAEKDPERTEQLLGLLQAVLKEDAEEIRTRMAFLAKKYSDAICESKAGD